MVTITSIEQKKAQPRGSMTTKEKREYVRRPVDVPVDFIVQGRLYQGQIKNINKEDWIRIGNVNKGGIFVETEISFSIGQNISMTYESPSYGKEKRTGKIIRVEPQGIGIKFQRLKRKNGIPEKA